MSIDYRAEFDIPRDICYLNAAYMTPQPRRVVEAAIRGATRRSQPWRITPADFFNEVEKLRAAFARQVGCSPDNIAIVPSASYGVSCAAANLPITRGDVILALNDQFPSNYYAWRRQALAAEAEFHIVSKEGSQSWADARRGVNPGPTRCSRPSNFVATTSRSRHSRGTIGPRVRSLTLKLSFWHCATLAPGSFST